MTTECILCYIAFDHLIKVWTLAFASRLWGRLTRACWRTTADLSFACAEWCAEDTHQQLSGEAYPCMTKWRIHECCPCSWGVLHSLRFKLSYLVLPVPMGVGTLFLMTRCNAFPSSPYAFRFDSTTDNAICNTTHCVEGMEVRKSFWGLRKKTRISTKPEEQEFEWKPSAWGMLALGLVLSWKGSILLGVYFIPV